MIISVSRRTDIPAFFSGWLINRLRAGHVDIVNPFNPNQKRRVDLESQAVDCLVFWTRNPAPLMRNLDEIDRMGHRYYFLYTITGYPRALEENLPPLKTAIRTFRALSDKIGPEKIIWRYDPIVLSSLTGGEFHIGNFGKIASELCGYTGRCIISYVDLYKKVKSRFKRIANERGIDLIKPRPELFVEIASKLKDIADPHDITIQSCAEDIDIASAGIQSGACIDKALINRLFGLDISCGKDPHQRERCLCAGSVDIGAYNTCGYRCVYCYANTSFTVALDNLKRVRDNDESLAGDHRGSAGMS